MIVVAKGMFLSIAALIAASAINASAVATAATTADWIVKSNEQAKALLQQNAKYSPESASAIGLDDHDSEVFDAKPHTVERQEADLDAIATGYEHALAAATDPRITGAVRLCVYA